MRRQRYRAARRSETPPPDVIVVDLNMPELSGLEACRRIKQTGSDVEVIVLTATDDRWIEQVALGLGAFALITKSKVAEHLLPAIQKACSRRLAAARPNRRPSSPALSFPSPAPHDMSGRRGRRRAWPRRSRDDRKSWRCTGCRVRPHSLMPDRRLLSRPGADRVRRMHQVRTIRSRTFASDC